MNLRYYLINFNKPVTINYKMKSSAPTWIWIIGGLMIGIAVIGFSISIFGSMMRSYQENYVIEQVFRLENRVEIVCHGGTGNMDFMTIELPDFVRAVYPAKTAKQEPPDRVAQLITDKEIGSGDYICLSFFDKPKPRCKKIGCKVNMSYIGSPSLKNDLFSILSKISGDYPTYKFSLIIEKGEDIVYVLREKRSIETCRIDGLEGVKVWGTCGSYNRPVLILFKDNVAVFGDIKPWISGSSPFVNVLSKVAEHFGNGRTLVVAEDKNVSVRYLSEDMKSLLGGLDAEWMNHSTYITEKKLRGFEQLWLIRPGWCDTDKRRNKINAGCYGIKEWTDSEIGTIANFVRNGGKLLIITYSSEPPIPEIPVSMPKKTVNKILENIDVPFEQIDGIGCKNEKFKPKPELGNIGELKIRYSARFCKK